MLKTYFQIYFAAISLACAFMLGMLLQMYLDYQAFTGRETMAEAWAHHFFFHQ